MKRRRGLVIMASIVMAMSVVVPARAWAVTGWRGPTEILTARSIFDLFIGVSSDDAIAVLARDREGIFALTDRSGTWERRHLVPDAHVRRWQGFAGVFDRDGNSYLAWARGCAGDDCSSAGIWYLSDADGGWPDQPRQLVSGPVRYPAIQLRDGRLHLAYIGSDSRLWYRRFEPDWSYIEVRVMGNALRVPKLEKPVMSVDASGRAHIVVQRYSSRISDIAWATDTGTDSEPRFAVRKVAGTGELDRAPVLTLDPQGRSRVAWLHTVLCGIDCTPDPREGTYTVAWKGSAWGTVAHPSTADPRSIRVTPDGRTRILVSPLRLLTQ